MKKLWWGVFFGVVIGVLLLAPESNFSYRIRDLFFTLQGTVVAVLDAAYTDPKQAIFALISGASIGSFCLFILGPWVEFEAKFAVIASLGGALLIAPLSLVRIDSGEQVSAQPSPTVADCQQCWAALPWRLAENHVDTSLGCREGTPFW